MFEIHPNAETNFNDKVSSLVNLIQEIPIRDSKKGFDDEIVPSVTINLSDTIGEMQEAESDYLGNTVCRFFRVGKIRYGLKDEHHKLLVEISEKIQRLPTFRNKLSQQFIEDEVFNWVRNSFISDNAEPFINILIEKAKHSVQPVTVYVPIAHTIIQSPFDFCGAQICNITKEVVEKFFSIGKAFEDEKQKLAFTSFTDDFQKKYQGYASVKIELVCEQKFADDLAIDIAQRIISFLGIYSDATLIPNIKCTSTIKGAEYLATATTFSQNFGKEGFNFSRKQLDIVSVWKISDNDINQYESNGLDILSEIYTKEKPTEFEYLILNTSSLYSKVAFTSEPIEKLVYVLSALESTLLKNESEPIQQNLAERLAFFTSDELSERKSIIKNVKFVYGLRSRYLHHGHSSDELDEISKFLYITWTFYVQLLRVSHTFKNKSQFLEAIDDRKLK